MIASCLDWFSLTVSLYPPPNFDCSSLLLRKTAFLYHINSIKELISYWILLRMHDILLKKIFFAELPIYDLQCPSWVSRPCIPGSAPLFLLSHLFHFHDYPQFSWVHTNLNNFLRRRLQSRISEKCELIDNLDVSRTGFTPNFEGIGHL